MSIPVVLEAKVLYTDFMDRTRAAAQGAVLSVQIHGRWPGESACCSRASTSKRGTLLRQILRGCGVLDSFAQGEKFPPNLNLRRIGFAER